VVHEDGEELIKGHAVEGEEGVGEEVEGGLGVEDFPDRGWCMDGVSRPMRAWIEWPAGIQGIVP